MVQICPQLGCSAVHDVDVEDEGRTIRCRRCASRLLVQGGGLVLVAGPVEDQSRPRPDQPAPEKAAPFSELPTKTQESEAMSVSYSPRGDAFTILFSVFFGIGTFLVILFLFLPLIDQASITRQRSQINLRESQKRRLERREAEEFLKGKVEDRANDRKNWEKDTDDLHHGVDVSQSNSRGRLLVYSWGMLFGFTILAVGALGFLTHGPTTARRVVGGIVLSGVILMVFLGYLIASTANSIILSTMIR